MGECYPPTAADYANHNAQEALARFENIKRRVEELVKLNEDLTQKIAILEGRIAALSFSVSKLKGQ